MISRETVVHIAKLSKLDLTAEETDSFRHHMSEIIDYFNQLSAIDTTGVEPMIAPSEVQLHLREDVVRRFTTVDEILRNAPEVDGYLFRVPPAV